MQTRTIPDAADAGFVQAQLACSLKVFPSPRFHALPDYCDLVISVSITLNNDGMSIGLVR